VLSTDLGWLALIFIKYFANSIGIGNPVPRGGTGVGREKALASAGHVSSVNIHMNGNV